jgi:sterol desaturase/sphingolipid hydroxylase (fatty acid hydroxylase superfamily)
VGSLTFGSITFLETLQSLGISFAVLALIFVPLERTFTGRTQPHLRDGLRLDILYFAAQYLVFMPFLLAANNRLQQWVGPTSPTALLEWVQGLPIYVQALLVVVLGDLLTYWAHRMSHEVPLLWRLHSVHHTAEKLDWMAAQREHPLDGLYSQISLNLPGFLLGVDMLAIMPVFVFRGLCANFVHSNVKMRLGGLGLLFGDPVLHRWYHARVSKTRHNFANLAPYLDVLFGTHHRPANENYPLGSVLLKTSGFSGHMLEPLLPERAWQALPMSFQAMSRVKERG